jgi:hypothetical protein
LPHDKKKKVPINYTDRDFNSIKDSLVSHAKRYYPDRYKDFSSAGFGSLLLDTVAYVGDVLSFYLDYQTNESFLETSIEYNNVLKHARQSGYKFQGVATSYGEVELYATVPALDNGIGPDMSYAPVIGRGTTFTSTGGIPFTLLEDVVFSNASEIIVASVSNDAASLPTHYALKAMGTVISGFVKTQTISIADYQRFPKLKINDFDVVEVISVFDTDGNQYYEVDNLSQDIVYRSVANKSEDKITTPFILKPFPVPRRFVTSYELPFMYMQFGYGTDENMNIEESLDSSKVALNLYGKNYISDSAFDPTNLIKSDKLGIVPSNTTLTVVYRKNGASNVNIAANTLTSIVRPIVNFEDSQNLVFTKASEVIQSIQVRNPNPISGDVSLPSVEEVKYRAYGMISSQSRAVTREDYLSLIYNMPSKFGAIKRASVVQDVNSFKRNLNIYTISENQNGNLSSPTATLKKNLKTWLSRNKMINDTIDILDAKIVNVGIQFEIMADDHVNKYDILNQAISALASEVSISKYNIGEPIRVSNFYRTLKNIDGLLDVVSIKIVKKVGTDYSSVDFDIKENTSLDGRLVGIPMDHIFEFKFPNLDIVGKVK